MRKGPTAAQKRLWSKVAALGCMACLADGNSTTPEIHHVKEYGGYRNHNEVFGLCPAHHRRTASIQGILNREKNPLEFRQKYGEDRWLFEECMRLLK